jgi:hypothetical protein
MSRLLPFFCCLLAALCAFGQAPTSPSTEAVKRTIHAIVRSQLEAFRRGDFAAAYEFAAPGIREKFPLAEFTEMVKTGYPEIAANTDLVFGLTFDDGHSAVIDVRVIGKEKVSRRFQYSLECTEKIWRITGVVPLPENEPAI